MKLNAFVGSGLMPGNPAILNCSSFCINQTQFKARFHQPHRSLKNVPLMSISSSKQSKDEVVIIGGGLIGLSCAVELAKMGVSVSVISRDQNEAAALAAAGMLAPQSEQLESGPLLDLCLVSRNLYPEWISSLQNIPGAPQIHYKSSGNFLRPILKSASIKEKRFQPPTHAGSASWIDNHAQVQALEPLLCGDGIAGAWWFPEDGVIDNVSLFAALQHAAEYYGVTIINSEAKSLNMKVKASRSTSNVFVDGVWMQNGTKVSAEHVIVAAGSWSRQILPMVPVKPIKGQMCCLKVPKDKMGNLAEDLMLRSTIFSENAYIVPRDDGRVIIGATVEHVGFDSRTTARGVHQLLNGALQLIPGLEEYELSSTWAGFRPATSDLLPVLGPISSYENVTVATGHHRNGVLLAPVTAKIVAAQVCNLRQPFAALDSALPHFLASRFVNLPSSSTSSNESNVYDSAAKPLNTTSQMKQDTQEVLLWEVGEDGEEIPVHYKQPPMFFRGHAGDTTDPLHDIQNDTGYVNGLNSRTESPLEKSGSGSNVVKSLSSESTSNSGAEITFEHRKNVSTKEMEVTSASNDAYDDVLVHQGKDSVRAESMRKNRSFGNNPISEGSSLDKSEWDRFEQVYNSALIDAEKELSMMDNPNDPALKKSIQERNRTIHNNFSSDSNNNTFTDGYF